MGVQRLRRRVRRAAAARRPAVRPARRPPGLHRRLGRPARRVARRRCRRQRRRRARRPRRPGRRCRAHRAVRADPADDAVRRQRQGAHQGARAVRRGRTGRRHRRGVPRRRPHRVRVVAVGVLPQHPHRAGRHRARDPGDAGRPRQPRPLDWVGAATVTAGLAAARVRHRPRPRGRLGLRADVARRSRRARPARAVRRHAGQAPAAADAARHLPHARPRRRQRRAVPARRGLDPDVVLPEPLPAAGARPSRVPVRGGAAADDGAHHGRHGRSSPRAPSPGSARSASLVAGMAVLAAGLGLLALVRPDGSFVVDVLPASLVAAAGMAWRSSRRWASRSPRPARRKAAWPPASSTPATRSGPRSAWPR